MRFAGFEEKDNVVQERQKKMTELKSEYDDVYERLTRVTGELAQTMNEWKSLSADCSSISMF